MLTVKEISTAQILPKPYKLSDGRGLYILVHPNGSKYWRYDYKFKDKRKTLALGVYPTISLLDARRKHFEAQSTLLEGIDPKLIKEKAESLQQRLFYDTAKEWHSKWCIGKNEKYQVQTWDRLGDNVFPAIGNIPIAELKPSHFKSVINNLVDRGVHDIAKRTLEKCKQIMRYAYVQEYIPSNPVSELYPRDIIPKRRKRNHPRITEQELPKLIADIHAYDGSELTVLATRFLMHTFVRTQELIKATWEEIDFDQKRWVLSPERMKMDRPHIVPLSTQMLKLLKQLKLHQKNSDYLFPSDKYGDPSHMSNNTVLYALYRMGYKSRMTGHGFRGVASTILHEKGYKTEHIELQLAHTEEDETKSAYNHALYLKQRTQMMQDWSDYLESKGDI